MSRTRRRMRPLDDPRNSRRLRQESGVNLMHEEPWFGFNVADKIPDKGDTDPSGNPFLGLPREKLANRAVGSDELGPNAVGRGNLHDYLNGDRLIKDGTLPISALASHPWHTKTEPEDVRRIIRKMVKATALK